MFQLLYLRFTQPRADPDGVRGDGGAGARRCWRIRWRARTSSSTRRSTPRSAGNNPRRAAGDPGDRRSVESRKALAFYKARFADASNFTFVFVGSFTPDDDQAARRDLPRQPAGDARARNVARSRHRAAARRRREDDREGHRAEEPGGDRLLGPVRLRRRAPAGAADDDAAAAVAAVRHDPPGARRHLQHHGDAGRRQVPAAGVRVRIDWTCDPARTATLVQRVFEEIELRQEDAR